MGLFSLDMVTAAPSLPQRNDGTSAAKVEVFESMHTAKVAIVKKHIPKPPAPGEVIFVWTTAQFNTMSLIIWLIEQVGPIDELLVSTYSISNICVNTMLKWLDSGKIGNIYLYLSDYVPRMSPAKYNALLAEVSARPGKMKIGLGFNHSKITLATIGKNRIVITGSGNFAENSGNEQYTICNNPEVYEFYKSRITEDHPIRYRVDRAVKAGGTPMEQ